MFGAFGEENEYLIVPALNEEGVTPEMIETECGLVISPVASADVILDDQSGVRIVFQAVYGRLPNGVVVLAVIDDEGVFPHTDEELDLKIILDPFIADDDFYEVDHVIAVPILNGHCELCGYDLEEGDDTDLDLAADINDLDEECED